MNNFDPIIFLENQLRNPLPGLEGQMKMAPPSRYDPQNERNRMPENPKLAAVLCLFFWKNAELHLALIERTSGHAQDRHSGQISFPGGKFEATDPGFEATALRETEEEIGVNREKIKILGKLTTLFIPVSGFLVHPFVGYLNEKTDWQPQPTEVNSILEVPLAAFRHLEARKIKHLTIGAMTLHDVPFFEFENHVIWGATAMILSELLCVLEE